MSIDERELSTEGKAILDASRDSIVKSWALGIVGAVLGAIVGWLFFDWAYNQGFYALAFPGAVVGLGFGALSRRPMIAGGIFCAIGAFFLTVGCDWSKTLTDDSYFTYLTKFHEVNGQMTLVMMGLGVVFAFWLGRGR